MLKQGVYIVTTAPGGINIQGARFWRVVFVVLSTLVFVMSLCCCIMARALSHTHIYMRLT
jgi:hypothetical protein